MLEHKELFNHDICNKNHKLLKHKSLKLDDLLKTIYAVFTKNYDKHNDFKKHYVSCNE